LGCHMVTPKPRQADFVGFFVVSGCKPETVSQEETGSKKLSGQEDHKTANDVEKIGARRRKLWNDGG